MSRAFSEAKEHPKTSWCESANKREPGSLQAQAKAVVLMNEIEGGGVSGGTEVGGEGAKAIAWT